MNFIDKISYYISKPSITYHLYIYIYILLNNLLPDIHLMGRGTYLPNEIAGDSNILGFDIRLYRWNIDRLKKKNIHFHYF